MFAGGRQTKPRGGTTLVTLRDISNAFPSIGHECMRSTLVRTADEWTRYQLEARHTKMHVKVFTGQGEALVVAPKCGGAQGTA